jgi:hypothetical protein
MHHAYAQMHAPMHGGRVPPPRVWPVVVCPPPCVFAGERSRIRSGTSSVVRRTWLESCTSQDAPGAGVHTPHTMCSLACSREHMSVDSLSSALSLTLEDPPDSPTVKAVVTVDCGVWGSASAKSGIGSVCPYHGNDTESKHVLCH